MNISTITPSHSHKRLDLAEWLLCWFFPLSEELFGVLFATGLALVFFYVSFFSIHNLFL